MPSWNNLDFSDEITVPAGVWFGNSSNRFIRSSNVYACAFGSLSLGHSCMTWIPTGVLIGELSIDPRWVPISKPCIYTSLDAVWISKFLLFVRGSNKNVFVAWVREVLTVGGFLANWIPVSLDKRYEVYGEGNFHTNNQPQYRSCDLLQWTRLALGWKETLDSSLHPQCIVRFKVFQMMRFKLRILRFLARRCSQLDVCYWNSYNHAVRFAILGCNSVSQLTNIRCVVAAKISIATRLLRRSCRFCLFCK